MTIKFDAFTEWASFYKPSNRRFHMFEEKRSCHDVILFEHSNVHQDVRVVLIDDFTNFTSGDENAIVIPKAIINTRRR